MPSLPAICEILAAQFVDAFPERVPSPRTVGRELELPLVDFDGSAVDVRRLWDHLATSESFKPKYDTGNPNLLVELVGAESTYAIEVGVGTMEINTRPCHSLFDVQRIAEQATARLVSAAARFSWRVLGYGVQPLTAPQLSIMTPKQRYQSLYRAMGAEWLWYTVTAADQCHVAIARHEVLHMLNFGNLMAPVIIAFCANSPVYAGKLSQFCSSREGHHSLIRANEHRHGMPAQPYTSMEDFVATISQELHLIRRSDNVVLPNARPFTAYLAEHGADYDAFLFHEHYIWNSARVRAAYGTVEMRPACQQPWIEHMAATALSVGVIEAADAIDAYVQTELGPDYWSIMRRYHQQTIRDGLNAPQPAPEFLATVLSLAEDGLRSRKLGEEILLAPLYQRLERRENPAQHARRIFLTDGLRGLLAHTAIRPEMVADPNRALPHGIR